jgi:hypothetical protein
MNKMKIQKFMNIQFNIFLVYRKNLNNLIMAIKLNQFTKINLLWNVSMQ